MAIVTTNNICVVGSSYLTRGQFDDVLKELRRDHADDNEVLPHRCDWSLRYEWAVHKACYRLGIARARTVSVDLDWPQPWYMAVAYIVIGLFVYPFV